MNAASLIEVTPEDGVILDIRYATADNLSGKPIYQRPTALLVPQAHAKLRDAVARAATLGLKIRLWDAYRPVEGQQILWDVIEDKRFAGTPTGGTHPRGTAVDLTLVDPATGKDLPMGTEFDTLTMESAHSRLDLPADILRNRVTLLGIMVASGWAYFDLEWWHFHLPNYADFPALTAAQVPHGPMDAA